MAYYNKGAEFHKFLSLPKEVSLVMQCETTPWSLTRGVVQKPNTYIYCTQDAGLGRERATIEINVRHMFQRVATHFPFS